MNIFLQIFLYLDVFIIGALFSIGLRHAYAHFRPTKPEKTPKSSNPDAHLSTEEREKLLAKSSDRFQHVIDHAAEQLEHELSSTGDRINTTVKKLAADIITKELESFQSMFRQYQEQASKELNEGKSETDKYKEELRAKVAEDIEKEKQQLIELLDQRLADSVISFLTETLQHEVDLGAQTDYLMSQLEAHKDELKKAVGSEA